MIRAIFSIFEKGQGRSSDPTSPDIRMHPKAIVSTSHQHFNNLIEIAAKNS